MNIITQPHNGVIFTSVQQLRLRTASPCINSDRGVQYASGEYRALLDGQDAVASMSRKGNCWDNAVAESFFATVEIELIEGADWHTRAEARPAVFEFIEVWYNRQRRHSSLGYLTPAEFNKRLWEATRASLPKAA